MFQFKVQVHQWTWHYKMSICHHWNCTVLHHILGCLLEKERSTRWRKLCQTKLSRPWNVIHNQLASPNYVPEFSTDTEKKEMTWTTLLAKWRWTCKQHTGDQKSKFWLVHPSLGHSNKQQKNLMYLKQQ